MYVYKIAFCKITLFLKHFTAIYSFQITVGYARTLFDNTALQWSRLIQME